MPYLSLSSNRWQILDSEEREYVLYVKYFQ